MEGLAVASMIADCDVLILEDDPLAAKLLAVLIERRTNKVVQVFCEVGDAEQSLRRAAAGEEGRLPSVLIADARIGTNTSFSLVQWIRTCPHTSHLRVLVISADEGDELRREAIDAGAEFVMSKADFLAKPGYWVWVQEFFPENANADESDAA